jgi:hypothetical protein
MARYIPVERMTFVNDMGDDRSSMGVSISWSPGYGSVESLTPEERADIQAIADEALHRLHELFYGEE